MAVDPKETLKSLIDDLTDEEARELLRRIHPHGPEEVDLKDVKEEYDEVHRRFEAAFRQLARS